MSLEFEAHDANAVGSAAEELRQRGFTLLHDQREEPWGQTVARLQSQEGSIIGISFASRCMTDPITNHCRGGGEARTLGLVSAATLLHPRRDSRAWPRRAQRARVGTRAAISAPQAGNARCGRRCGNWDY